MQNLTALNQESKSAQLQNYLDKLLLNWAEVEAYKIQDKKKVAELMEGYVKGGNSQQVMAWANYIKLMRCFPDHDKTLRGLFRRGINLVKEGKTTLGELWLEWEKKFGTIQTLTQCIKHLKKVMVGSHSLFTLLTHPELA